MRVSRRTGQKPDAQAFGRKLRKSMTPAECHFWEAVRRKALGFRVLRQYAIGPFFADFYIPRRKVVIEIDGPYHRTHSNYDARRTQLLTSRGYRVLRFTNEHVFTQLQSVLEQVAAV